MRACVCLPPCRRGRIIRLRLQSLIALKSVQIPAIIIHRCTRSSTRKQYGQQPAAPCRVRSVCCNHTRGSRRVPVRILSVRYLRETKLIADAVRGYNGRVRSYRRIDWFSVFFLIGPNEYTPNVDANTPSEVYTPRIVRNVNFSLTLIRHLQRISSLIFSYSSLYTYTYKQLNFGSYLTVQRQEVVWSKVN